MWRCDSNLVAGTSLWSAAVRLSINTWKTSFECVSEATKVTWILLTSLILTCPVCSSVCGTCLITRLFSTLTSEWTAREPVHRRVGVRPHGGQSRECAGFRSIGCGPGSRRSWRLSQSFAVEGKIVGGIALGILNGKSPQDIPAVQGANAYIFDERALRRWGFKESDLPSGSDVLFRGPSFWERTKWKWVASSLIILSLTILALYIRLKLAKDRALALSGMLITAQEKERSRLASEIHDDFSQRMALLALGLENAEEAIGASPNEAVRQVHDLLNSASEIGADLHTFSHRLHSSTLERLGLFPGLALCVRSLLSKMVLKSIFGPTMFPVPFTPMSLCAYSVLSRKDFAI